MNREEARGQRREDVKQTVSGSWSKGLPGQRGWAAPWRGNRKGCPAPGGKAGHGMEWLRNGW